MKKDIKVLFIIFALFSSLYSLSVFSAAKNTHQASSAIQVVPKFKQPEKVLIGVYVRNIYDLSLADNSFKTVFWAWFIHANTPFDIAKSLDVVNAKDFKGNLFTLRKVHHYFNSMAVYHADMIMNWDLRNFPFDRQILTIYLEDTNFNISQMVFVPDLVNSKIDPEVQLAGWTIAGFKFFVDKKIYDIRYNTPTVTYDSIFSRAVFQIELVRHSWRKFFQFFSATYLALFLSLCVFFLPVDTLGPKVALLGGAIFATFGNKYLLDSMLPPSPGMTLIDYMQLLTFIFLAFSMFITIVATYLNRSGHGGMAKYINFIAAISSLVILPALNIYLFYNAMH